MTSTIGPWIVAAILTVLGSVWAGAELAAITIRHRLASITLADTTVALTRLPSHVVDPNRAWPARARHAIPGPIGYWAATAVVVGLSVTIIVIVARLWNQHDGEHRGRGFARRVARANPSGFARRHELALLTVGAPTFGRLMLGRVGRRLVAAEPQTSLAVIGPTGCGKTAGFAIPALREWEGPVIATSVKTDLLDTTLPYRAARGRVWIYDPTGTSSKHKTSRWSPLAACGTWAGAMRVAAWLCEAAQPRNDTVTDGDYWYAQARKGLAPYLYAAAIADRPIRDVVRWIDRQERDQVETILSAISGYELALREILETPATVARGEAIRDERQRVVIEEIQDEVGNDDDSTAWVREPVETWDLAIQEVFHRRVQDAIDAQLAVEYADEIAKLADTYGTDGGSDALIAARALWGKEQRLKGSVYATIENVLAGYADPNVAQAATTSADVASIDLAAWLTGDHTIYVIAPAHEQARLRPVLTVLVQQAIRTAYETANRNRGTLRHPLLVMLDEAGNIAPLRDLPTVASTARSHGISLVTIWQDLSQLKAIYADRARTVLNNHQAKLFGAGIADEITLEYVSRLVGEQPHTDVNRSGDLHGPRRTITEHTTWRRSAPADTLRRLPRDQGILLYGNLAPIHLRLRPWYRTERRSSRFRVASRRVGRA
jgi:Type IV secretory pathway, VirD4 components